jgi:hypothetical protein
MFQGVYYPGIFPQEHDRCFAVVAGLIDAVANGQLKVLIDRVFPLAEAAVWIFGNSCALRKRTSVRAPPGSTSVPAIPDGMPVAASPEAPRITLCEQAHRSQTLDHGGAKHVTETSG